MGLKVDNAVIMAAGTSSRFAPLSYERHKAMTEVKGEILIERQIRQLREAGVPEIYIITGYKEEQFNYLVPMFGVKLIHNPEYLTRNNNGSIWAARNILKSSYVCSADNYFASNPFEAKVDESYYAAEYAEGFTDEWCLTTDMEGYIDSVTIGGEKSWFMMGHTFWSSDFTNTFLSILDREYRLIETRNKLWESIFIDHLDKLKMKIRRYAPGIIYEFDTLDELRQFDQSYLSDTRSALIKQIACELNKEESQISNIRSFKGDTSVAEGFEFDCCNHHYRYTYKGGILEEIN